jgi:hypothetical protein
MHHFMPAHDSGFAWSEEEQGSFRTNIFPPVNFPVIPYTPWVERNFPIPPGIYEDICAIAQKDLLLASMSCRTHLIDLGGFAS